MWNSYNLQIIIIFLLFFSCKKYQAPIQNIQDNTSDSFFVDLNKTIIQKEEQLIDSIINASNVSFFRDTTGIRLFMTDPICALNCPVDGDYVLLGYNCVILNEIDNILDDSLLDTLSFKIGYSKQMKGLNYAIKLLNIGDKAKIIIPSYLGFGMSGYGKTVPPYSTLLLNVKLLNIKK